MKSTTEPSLPLVALMVTTLGDALTAAAVISLTESWLLTITVPGWLPELTEPHLRQQPRAPLE